MRWSIRRVILASSKIWFELIGPGRPESIFIALVWLNGMNRLGSHDITLNSSNVVVVKMILAWQADYHSRCVEVPKKISFDEWGGTKLFLKEFLLETDWQKCCQPVWWLSLRGISKSWVGRSIDTLGSVCKIWFDTAQHHLTATRASKRHVKDGSKAIKAFYLTIWFGSIERFIKRLKWVTIVQWFFN